VIADVADRLRGMTRVALRATPVPLGVRCAVFLTGLVAVVLAFPAEALFARGGWLLLAAPLVPAALPRGRMTTALAGLVIIGWLAATTVGGRPVELWRLLALSGALYLLHTLAALAAVLPYDAIVPVVVVVRWAGRALAVLLGSAVLAVAVLTVVEGTGSRPMLTAALLGLAVAVGVAGLMVYLWRRG
jgi:hypothetical protein